MLLLWLACNTTPPPIACQDMGAGLDRDICLSKRLEALPSPERASLDAALIADPVVRGAAVMRWVEAHNKAWNPQQVLPLCDQLQGRDRGACHRRVQSAHLNR
ncbi:MAG: hypothetical protein ACI9VR_000319 [Cognaticolwellia sp.]|jgi:hypothetical protein